MSDSNNAKKNIALKISYAIFACNVFLAIGKLLTGIFGNSTALIYDAINSFSDALSTVVVIIALIIANKESDSKHQYGHERFECVASIVLSVVLLGTAVIMGYDAIRNIINGLYKTVDVPTTLALIGSILSIVIKCCMFTVAFLGAKKTKSIVLKADSKNHLSDIVASTGTLIGVAVSIMGYPIADTIASIVICLFIAKVAFDVFKDAVSKMTDKACDNKTVDKMKEVIISVDGVIHIDSVKTRMFGNKIYMDVIFSADKDMSLEHAHRIAETVHERIEEEFPDVKHCMIHVNAYDHQTGEDVDDDRE